MGRYLIHTIILTFSVIGQVLANFEIDIKRYNLSKVVGGHDTYFAKFPDNSYQLLDKRITVEYGPNVHFNFSADKNRLGLLVGERLRNVAHIYQRVQGIIHEFHPYVYVVQFVDNSCQFYNLGLPLGTRLMDVVEIKGAFNGYYITFNRPQGGRQQIFFNMNGIEMDAENSKYDNQVWTMDLLNLDKLADIRQVHLIDTDFAKGYRATLSSGFFIVAYVNQAGEYVCSKGNIYTDKITVLKQAKEYFEKLDMAFKMLNDH